MYINLNDVNHTKINMRLFGTDRIILPIHYDDRGNKSIFIKGKKPYRLLNEPMFFDCETSHNHDEDNPVGWIYQWAALYHTTCIGGRKPSEFIRLLHMLERRYNLGEDYKLVIYIHNASYDLTYLMQFLHQEYSDIQILALKSHKILELTCGGFIFKCSYLLSNRSLEQWCNYTKSDVHKAIGAVDYELIRYQDEELTYNDWYYQVNDVYAMQSAYYKMLQMFGDDISSIPMTNTSYVRRDARKLSRGDRDNFLKLKMDAELYQLGVRAFRGALSGGNRYKANRTIRGNIGHKDYKSCYPSVQELDYFPITKFSLYYKLNRDNPLKFNDLLNLCNRYCVLMELTFHNLRIRKSVTCCYETIARARAGAIGRVKFTNEYGLEGGDNGRIINMEGYCKFAITELDLKWILKQYATDGIQIDTVYIADRGKLPEWLRHLVNDYFIKKESLPDGTERDKSKNNINACYGMTATHIVRNEYNYDWNELDWKPSHNYDLDYIQEQLDKYYKSRNSFMSYQFGIYTTAHARDRLMTMISETIGYDNFIYCDTDSAFYMSTPEVEERIDNYNIDIIELNKSLGLGVPNIKGKTSYYMTFEDEKENIQAFRFLHSKCYAFIDGNKKLHCTIAGVERKSFHIYEGNGFTMKKSVTNAEELGTIDNLVNGFVFYDCGATKCKYVEHEPSKILIDGHEIEFASAAIISRTTKTLGALLYLDPEEHIDWEVE